MSGLEFEINNLDCKLVNILTFLIFLQAIHWIHNQMSQSSYVRSSFNPSKTEVHSSVKTTLRLEKANKALFQDRGTEPRGRARLSRHWYALVSHRALYCVCWKLSSYLMDVGIRFFFALWIIGFGRTCSKEELSLKKKKKYLPTADPCYLWVIPSRTCTYNPVCVCVFASLCFCITQPLILMVNWKANESAMHCVKMAKCVWVLNNTYTLCAT